MVERVTSSKTKGKRPRPPAAEGAVYYSASDLARRFGVHIETIWKWDKDEILPPATRLAPNSTKWSVDLIHEWERDRTGVRPPRRPRKLQKVLNELEEQATRDVKQRGAAS
jgi:predicted DNA-binding transcriptional regulator AlpA